MTGSLYARFIKRLLDLLFSSLGLIILAPVFLAIAIAVRLDSDGSVLFTQPRVGKDGAIFRLYKFRTMITETMKDGRQLDDEERLTRVGRFLRRLSLDELPQLINVLNGTMSLIGPRPLLVKYLPYYTEEESKRHSVLPGISGWAQVNGRNAISWEDKFQYDLEYVSRISFAFDVKIALMTVMKVFKRSDIFLNRLADLDVERRGRVCENSDI
ncbi:MAG TPA: sugar transferase [Candidatus Atribacteria bacterium]|nr:sugar transferase [Candidatus Atribacteria bacterium]HPT79369.1 sugar transferase [Candidatus Atribacteria bacterium]